MLKVFAMEEINTDRGSFITLVDPEKNQCKRKKITESTTQAIEKILNELETEKNVTIVNVVPTPYQHSSYSYWIFTRTQ